MSQKQLSWSAVEFIQKPSSAIIRWLVIVVLVAVFGTLLVGFLIPMHITVTASGRISSELGEFDLIAQRSGLFIQVAAENSTVKEGDIVGYIQPRGFSKEQLTHIVKTLEYATNAQFSLAESAISELHKIYPADKWKLADPEYSLPMIQLFSVKESYQEIKKKNEAAIKSETLPLRQSKRQLDDKIAKLRKTTRTKDFAFFIENLEDDARKISIQIAQIENSYNIRIQQSRQAFEDEIRKALLQINNFVVLSEIRAPVSGKIHHWAKESKATVSASSVLGQMVPENSQILAKIDVTSKDQPLIKEGQSIALKLEAYPYEKYGPGSGQVQYIKNIKSDKNTYEVTATLRAPANITETEIPIGSEFIADITTQETNLTLYLLKKIFGDRF